MLYGAMAVSTFVCGMAVSGPLVIDRGGVRVGLVIGSLIVLIARALLVFLPNTPTLAWSIFTTLIPISMSLYLPVMILGIQRVTSGRTRTLGYSLFYGMLCLGSCLAGPFVDWARDNYTGNYFQVVFMAGMGISGVGFMVNSFAYRAEKAEKEVVRESYSETVCGVMRDK